MHRGPATVCHSIESHPATLYPIPVILMRQKEEEFVKFLVGKIRIFVSRKTRFSEQEFRIFFRRNSIFFQKKKRNVSIFIAKNSKIKRIMRSLTTVPTPGTEYVSSIWNSAGNFSMPPIRVVSKFRNIFNRSKLSPVTFDTWKIGHKRCDTKFVALSTTSSDVRTITGTLRHPCDFNTLHSNFKLSCRIFGGHISILVTTTNTGTDNASANPKCSFVIPTMPAFAPIYKRKGISSSMCLIHVTVPCSRICILISYFILSLWCSSHFIVISSYLPFRANCIILSNILTLSAEFCTLWISA